MSVSHVILYTMLLFDLLVERSLGVTEEVGLGIGWRFVELRFPSTRACGYVVILRYL
jgi:hypothetical protein